MALLNLLGSGLKSVASNPGIGAGATTAISNRALDAILNATANPATQALGIKAGQQLLPTGGGSTLEGLVPRGTLSSKLDTIAPKRMTLGEASAGAYNNISDLIDDIGVQDALEALPKASSNRLLEGTKNTAREMSLANTGSAGVTAKSQLPKIRTSDYVKATGLSGEDIPAYMRNYLSESNGRALNDIAWSETFPQYASSGEGGAFTGTADDILGEYERLLDDTAAANRLVTDENAKTFLGLNPEEDSSLAQEWADDIAGYKQLKVKGGESPAKNVKISRMKAETPKYAETAAEPKTSQAGSEAVENMINSGSSNNGGNGKKPPVTTSGFAEEGDTGFNFEIGGNRSGNGQQNVDTTPIEIGGKPRMNRLQARGKRGNEDLFAKSIGAKSGKQYQNIIGKSNSKGGFYSTVAKRGMAEKLNSSNISEKVGNAISARAEANQMILEKATENGVMIDLPKITLTKADLDSLNIAGIDTENLLNGSVTPVEAERLYTAFRDRGNRLQNSTDGISIEKGEGYSNIAKKINDAINEQMNSMGYDETAKQALTDIIRSNGEDKRYGRYIAESTDFKYSDLRKDMADWMSLRDSSSNPLDNSGMNFEGINLGIPNVGKKIGEKTRKAFYTAEENLGRKYSEFKNNGGSSPNANPGDVAQSSALGGLIKKGAPYVGGAVLGYALGSSGDDGGENITPLATSYAQQTAQEVQDPYETVTLGGYTYADYEEGYLRALQAGDTNAAKQIASIMDIIENKISRLEESQSSNSMSAGMNALNELYDLYQTAGGSQGVVRGNITNALNSLTGGGYNSDVAAYEAMKQSTTSLIIRALGEKGTLSDKDRETIAKALPNITDNPAAAEKKFEALYNMLLTAQ